MFKVFLDRTTGHSEGKSCPLFHIEVNTSITVQQIGPLQSVGRERNKLCGDFKEKSRCRQAGKGEL